MATRTIDKIKDLNGDTNLLKDSTARTLLGSDTLETTAQYVTGAINELNTEISSMGDIVAFSVVEVTS